jgi:hypothetical protein
VSSLQKQTLEARIRGKTFREIYDASRRIEIARARFQRATQFSSLAFVKPRRSGKKLTPHAALLQMLSSGTIERANPLRLKFFFAPLRDTSVFHAKAQRKT